MANIGTAIERWIGIYWEIVRAGWVKMPENLLAMPVEERCAILRGMMVEAGKSGLLPSLTQVMDMMEKEGASAELPARPVAPAQAAEAKPEPPKPGQQTISEAPETIASPGTKQTAQGPRMATQNQIDAIRKFCSVPRLKGFVAETLRTKGLGSAEGLTFDEAFELVGKLHEMKASHIPPGAKVTTGAKA